MLYGIVIITIMKSKYNLKTLFKILFNIKNNKYNQRYKLQKKFVIVINSHTKEKMNKKIIKSHLWVNNICDLPYGHLDPTLYAYNLQQIQ